MDERCPNIIARQAGDESIDLCELNDNRLCMLVQGFTCDEWEEIKKEWKEE